MHSDKKYIGHYLSNTLLCQPLKLFSETKYWNIKSSETLKIERIVFPPLPYETHVTPTRIKNKHTTGQRKSTHNNKLYYQNKNLFMGINI